LAEFQALYEEEKHLGKGGCGSVWAGIRKQDDLRVAIKHIPMEKVVMAEGSDRPTCFPLEISLMLKVQGERGSASPGAAVLLLDWFELDQELILVQERPVPSTDLLHYMKRRCLEEQEAKMIMQQVIKAITDIHSKGVLHRDIKPENILIETGSDVPRVRIIDFGYGCLLHNGEHHQFSGTFRYCPPEWFKHQSYRAEPLNVWQVGVLAYFMLVGKHPFSTKKEIISKEPWIGRGLSPNCQEFVWSCLAKEPQERLPLDSLLAHPWLQ
ncbi:serine/threonine-protein kinase pim-2, partial [Gadus morhua]